MESFRRKTSLIRNVFSLGEGDTNSAASPSSRVSRAGWESDLQTFQQFLKSLPAEIPWGRFSGLHLQGDLSKAVVRNLRTTGDCDELWAGGMI